MPWRSREKVRRGVRPAQEGEGEDVRAGPPAATEAVLTAAEVWIQHSESMEKESVDELQEH
jgi:hypothetical protein